MKILIYGIKKTAKNIAKVIYQEKVYEIAGFIGNKEEVKKFKNKRIFLNYHLLGTLEEINNIKKNDNQINGFIIGTGDAIRKEGLYYEFEKNNFIPVNVIAKSSSISLKSKIGKGVFVGENSKIKNVEIGNNVFIGNYSIIKENSKISNNTIIESKTVIEKNTKIQRGVKISDNCKIKKNITVGKNNKIKSKSIIKKNLEPIQRYSN